MEFRAYCSKRPLEDVIPIQVVLPENFPSPLKGAVVNCFGCNACGNNQGIVTFCYHMIPDLVNIKPVEE